MKRIIIAIIIIVGLIAAGGAYFLWRNKSGVNVQQQLQSMPQSAVQDQSESWKTYRNEQYRFELKYPDILTNVGTAAPNSALGSADSLVEGLFVGPLVFVILNNDQLKQKAMRYFEMYDPSSNNYNKNLLSCQRSNIDNELIKIKFVHCSRVNYSYIQGKYIDIFVDAYSGGYSNDGYKYFGSLDTDQLKTILSSFRFFNF